MLARIPYRTAVSSIPSGQLFFRSRRKPLPIFKRIDESLHHLGIDEVAAELVQLRQPKVITGVIRVRQIVRIAAQITEELHQHESPVEFIRHERRVLCYAPQRAASRREIARVGCWTK